MISISQGFNWYNIPVVRINGKLNETIEVSVLWTIWISLHRTIFEALNGIRSSL